jgi:hypothetical protein
VFDIVCCDTGCGREMGYYKTTVFEFITVVFVFIIAHFSAAPVDLFDTVLREV